MQCRTKIKGKNEAKRKQEELRRIHVTCQGVSTATKRTHPPSSQGLHVPSPEIPQEFSRGDPVQWIELRLSAICTGNSTLSFPGHFLQPPG